MGGADKKKYETQVGKAVRLVQKCEIVKIRCLKCIVNYEKCCVEAIEFLDIG